MLFKRRRRPQTASAAPEPCTEPLDPALYGKLVDGDLPAGWLEFHRPFLNSRDELLLMLESETACAPDNRDNTVVLIGTNCLGSGDDTLGATLMKGFLYALSQQERLPRTILFYNGGAKVTTEGSVSIEDLKNMEAQGVEIRTCGTCLNYYGLTDKLAVGSVTNMYDIVETMTSAGKVIRP